MKTPVIVQSKVPRVRKMDDAEKFIISAIVNLILVLPLSLISLLPTWFAIHSDWGAYLFWLPITIPLSRIACALMIILCPIMSLVTLKYTHLFNTLRFIILTFWGLPLLRVALTNLVTQSLIGIELQTTLIQIIVVELLAISATLAPLKIDKGEKE